MAKTATEELVAKPAQDQDGLPPLSEKSELSADFNLQPDPEFTDLSVDPDSIGVFEGEKEADHSFGRHKSFHFYRRHPDMKWSQLIVGTIKTNELDESWIVAAQLCKQLERYGLIYKRVWTMVDEEMDLLFGMYKVAQGGKSLDTWNQSAADILGSDYASQKWFKFIPRPKNGGYAPLFAVEQDAYPEPDWPREDYEKLVLDTVKHRYIGNEQNDTYRHLIGKKPVK